MPSTKEQIESSSQYQALVTFTQFHSGDAAAVTKLTSQITSTTPSTTISNYLETLWNSLLLIVSQTEHTSQIHSKFANLLQRLQTEPCPEDSPAPEYNDVPFSWSQLPDLNIYIRDWYNFSPPFTPESSSSSSSSSPVKGLTFGAEEWINFNAFLANLTKLSLKNTDPTIDSKPTDYSLYAIWSLRCFEVHPDALDQVDTADVRAAAVWIVTAGKELHKLCKEERKYDGNLARGGDAYRDREWRGFCMDRWAVWEEAFMHVLDNVKEDGDSVILGLFRQAKVAMRLTATSDS